MAMFEVCQSPFCKSSLNPSARRPKRYCSPRCKLDHWAILRTAELVALAGLTEEQTWEVLREVVEAEAEVVTEKKLTEWRAET